MLLKILIIRDVKHNGKIKIKINFYNVINFYKLQFLPSLRLCHKNQEIIEIVLNFQKKFLLQKYITIKSRIFLEILDF